MIKWLTVRLRAHRINNIRRSRLVHLALGRYSDDENAEQKADLCAQINIRSKAIRTAMKFGGDIQAHKMREHLEGTRLQRILGWELD